MTTGTRPVMLVGFQQQGNLGIRYPILIGFSLVFQFYIRRHGGRRDLRADAGRGTRWRLERLPHEAA